MINLYKVLGVPFTASPESIKAVYRELSLCWHPDRPGGDAARFQTIAEAYQVLSNPESRSRWDALRLQWLADRDAVDCPHCWTPNRLRLHGLAMRCGSCQAPLTNVLLTGRITISTHLRLYDRADQEEGIVKATVDEDALLGVDLSGSLSTWLLMLLTAGT